MKVRNEGSLPFFAYGADFPVGEVIELSEAAAKDPDKIAYLARRGVVVVPDAPKPKPKPEPAERAVKKTKRRYYRSRAD